jgi:hypothetical protein
MLVLHEFFFHGAFLLLPLEHHVVLYFFVAHEELVLVRSIAAEKNWFWWTFFFVWFSYWWNVGHHLDALVNGRWNKETRSVSDEIHIHISRHVVRIIWSCFLQVFLLHTLVLSWVVTVLDFDGVTGIRLNVWIFAIKKLFLKLSNDLVNDLIFLK